MMNIAVHLQVIMFIAAVILVVATARFMLVKLETWPPHPSARQKGVLALCVSIGIPVCCVLMTPALQALFTG